jgi:hypothetical protein
LERVRLDCFFVTEVGVVEDQFMMYDQGLSMVHGAFQPPRPSQFASAISRQNYGGILMIWDRLFGTYELENEPVIYGLTNPINSVNPWEVHFEEAARLIRKFRLLKTRGAKLQLLVLRPDIMVIDND